MGGINLGGGAILVNKMSPRVHCIYHRMYILLVPNASVITLFRLRNQATHLITYQRL